MSPFPIHPPVTSDQVSAKSLERLPGKSVNGRTDTHTHTHGLSQVVAQLKLRTEVENYYCSDSMGPAPTKSQVQKQRIIKRLTSMLTLKALMLKE